MLANEIVLHHKMVIVGLFEIKTSPFMDLQSSIIILFLILCGQPN